MIIPPMIPSARQVAWSVVALDDCDECGDVRVVLTLEEVGRPGTGLAAHLAPDTARKLRSALVRALSEIGESG